MRVKTYARVRGIPNAVSVVTSGQDAVGARRVVEVISAVDIFKVSETVASLSMSPAEARLRAARLLAEADLADAMSEDSFGVKS